MGWVVVIPSVSKSPNLHKLLGYEVIRDVSVSATMTAIALDRAATKIERIANRN